MINRLVKGIFRAISILHGDSWQLVVVANAGRARSIHAGHMEPTELLAPAVDGIVPVDFDIGTDFVGGGRACRQQKDE